MPTAIPYAHKQVGLQLPIAMYVGKVVNETAASWHVLDADQVLRNPSDFEPISCSQSNNLKNARKRKTPFFMQIPPFLSILFPPPPLLSCLHILLLVVYGISIAKAGI